MDNMRDFGKYKLISKLSGSIMKSKVLEWFGVVTAIMYSMMVALNIGVEFTGFLLLLVSGF